MAHETAQPGFSPDEAAKALSAEQHQTRDIAHGTGVALTVTGQKGERQLEVFDSGRAARLYGPTFRVEAVGKFQPHIREGRVWLTSEQDGHLTTLGLRADGSVIFSNTPQAVEAPTPSETPPS